MKHAKLSDLIKEAKVIVYNEKTGERYEVLSGKGKGDLMIAMKALQKAAPSHMKYSIKESVNEVQYKDAVAKFNDELIKHPMVKKAAQHYKKTPADIVKVLQQRLYTKGDRSGNTKEVYIDFKDTTSGITIKHKMKFNESVNESKFAVVNVNNGNTVGHGMKDQAANTAKKMGGEKSGYFVVPANNALKARRAAEKYNFDFKNPKLKSILFDLQFESMDTSVTEGYSTEEKRIVLMAVKKIMNYKNVDMKTAMMYVLGAGKELESDIQKGKVK